jgi:rhomboid protease GluP
MLQFQLRYSFVEFVKRFPVTSFLLLLWCLLYLYTASRFGLDYNEDLNILAGMVPIKVSEGQYWRLISYAYLHNGIEHFLTNLIFLFFFGPPAEQRLRPALFITFHMLSVIVSGLAIYFFAAATAVGGSGFEYALLGFYLYPSFFLRGGINGKLRTAVLIVAGAGFIMSLSVSSVSISGHLGGLFAGFIFAVVYFRNRSSSYSADQTRQ